jgi:hypothetical protein
MGIVTGGWVESKPAFILCAVHILYRRKLLAKCFEVAWSVNREWSWGDWRSGVQLGVEGAELKELGP